MIFTANDVRYTEINIINNRRQMVQKAAILANDNRVAQFGRIVFYFAAYQIMPADFAGSQAEADGQQIQTDDQQAASVWFTEDSTLAWPASGPVIMSYSMDRTVFFQTLEQYQYNPAMVVSGEVGETIKASAAGIVTNIEEKAETGTTVTLDMGNGYNAVYGQLTDVPLAIGDHVNAGETVGILAEPTKYFSVEGPNLYFEVTKDGEPVDPLNYME